MRRVYDLRVHSRWTHTEITPAKVSLCMRDNECSILWVWHRKVGHLTAMIPVGVIFITFKQPQRAFLSTVFSCKLTAALPLCTVVTFVSESQPLNLQTNKDLLTLGQLILYFIVFVYSETSRAN